MEQKVITSLALRRLSFKRTASILTFTHTLDRTVDEFVKKSNIQVFLDTHICTCTAVVKRHLPALQR